MCSRSSLRLPLEKTYDAVPRVAHGVDRQRRLAAGDEVIVIARVRRVLERRVGRVGPARRRAGQQHVDRVADELDVAVLLGRDVGDQVVERPHLVAAAEVERLKRVVHQRGHLAELAAEQFLHGGRGVRRRMSRHGQFDRKTVDSQNHLVLPLVARETNRAPSVSSRVAVRINRRRSEPIVRGLSPTRPYLRIVLLQNHNGTHFHVQDAMWILVAAIGIAGNKG